MLKLNYNENEEINPITNSPYAKPHTPFQTPV